MAAGSKVKSVNRKEWKMSDYIQENTKEIPVKYQLMLLLQAAE